MKVIGTKKRGIIFCIRYLFKKVIIKKIDNGIICFLPLSFKNKKENNIIRRLNKIIEQHEIEYIVFGEKIKQILINKNQINCNILNGKILMKNIISKILKEICNIRKEEVKLQNIYVFINEYNEKNIEILEDLANKVKCLNIITEKVSKFQKFEQYIYEKQGIMVTVSNNRRKSVKKAGILINFDFDNEKIQKYNIYRQSIIINLSENNINIKSSFNGIIINYIKIIFKKVEENLEIYDFCKEFNTLEIYESIKINYNFIHIINQIETDKVKIVEFTGNNGKIDIYEFKEHNI